VTTGVLIELSREEEGENVPNLLPGEADESTSPGSHVWLLQAPTVLWDCYLSPIFAKNLIGRQLVANNSVLLRLNVSALRVLLFC